MHVPRVPNPRFAGCRGWARAETRSSKATGASARILEALDRLKFTDARWSSLRPTTGRLSTTVTGTRRWRSWARTNRRGRFVVARGATSRPVHECLSRTLDGPITPGVLSALVSQIDLLASLASFTGQKLADADAPDSFDVMPALLGKTTTGRGIVVKQSTALSLATGIWKYIEPSQGPAVTANTNIETGNDPNGQLYDLGSDLGERQNLAAKYPKRMREMAARLAEIRSKGRSRP